MILQLENFDLKDNNDLEPLKKVIDSLLMTADTVSDITADGKVNFLDFPKLAQLGGAVAGFSQLPQVLKTVLEITSEQREELRDYVGEVLQQYELDKQHDIFENIVSKVIEVAIALISLIQNLKKKR